MAYYNGQLLAGLGANMMVVDEVTLNKLITTNQLYNNKKMNDENNVFYYKGYKMLYDTAKLSEDKKSITIELRDADLELKAIDNYETGDLVNVEASSSLYQRQKIAQLSTNPETKNTLITLVEIEKDAEISFNLKQKEAEQSDEDYEINENWIWVADKFVGEDIPSFAYAVASGHNTHAIGHGAFSTGCNNKVHGHYGAVFGKENLATFCAFATGLFTKALGIRAVTFGCKTTASATDAIAMGAQSKAKGQSSFAGGDNSETNGVGSFAYGLRATTKGNYSSALGRDTQATGHYSFATGQNTTASGENALATGYHCQATGGNSFAQGNSSQATGGSSAAFGTSSVASGGNSFAIGYLTKATGGSSFAGGSSSAANKEGSFSFGLRTNTNNNYQAVFGKDNDTTTAYDALFVVGNGTSSNKSNAFKVNSNGTATVNKDPVNNMDVATKQYVDRLEKEIETLKQAIINLGGVINE